MSNFAGRCSALTTASRYYVAMRWTRFKGMVLTVAVMSLVSGCGVIQIAYDRAHWLLAKRIDSYFDLNSRQEDKLEPTLLSYTNWLKKKPFDQGLALLVDAEAKIADGLTAQELHALDTSTKTWWRSIYARAAADGARFVHTLSREQLQHAHDKFAESDENLEELLEGDAEDFADDYEDYFDKVYDYYEKFVGDLTPEQKRLIWKARSRTRAQLQTRLNMRRAYRKHMMDAITAEPTEAGLVQLFQRWAANPSAIGGKAYLAHRAREDQEWERFILAFDRTVTKKQRAHAMDELHSWIHKLRSIDR